MVMHVCLDNINLAEEVPAELNKFTSSEDHHGMASLCASPSH